MKKKLEKTQSKDIYGYTLIETPDTIKPNGVNYKILNVNEAFNYCTNNTTTKTTNREKHLEIIFYYYYSL